MLIKTTSVVEDDYIDLALRKTVDIPIWARVTDKVEINSLLLSNEIIQNTIRDEAIPRRRGLTEVLC